MKTLVITENQFNTLKSNISESAVGNERYSRQVSVDVETYHARINGQEIDWATAPNITINYLIEMEHRSWGIKNVSLYSIQGPSEIELTITPRTEDGEDVDITIPLNWDMVEQETEEGEGVITVGNEINVVLGNDESGNIIVTSIHVPVYTL